jgi:hypothetical protein
MARFFISNTTYFLQEGKENLDECIRLALEAAAEHGIRKVLVFTGAGEGLRKAEEVRGGHKRYQNICLVGVTFPQGKDFTSEELPHCISEVDTEWFKSKGVPIVRAHLPFDPIRANYVGRGVLAQDSSLIGNAIGIFGGGMSLCVQAALMACDAGEVAFGEHAIAVSADTAILVRCAPTARFLTDLVIREIICKPVFLSISKKEALEDIEELPFDSSPLLEGEANNPE